MSNSHPSARMSTIEVNMVLTQVTQNLFLSGYPRELVMLITEFYHRLYQVKMILGKGNFTSVGAGDNTLTLFIIDPLNGSWVGLPSDSNGYVIHSPDGLMMSAWCGSPDYNYRSKASDVPKGIELYSLDDPACTAKEKFQTWKLWEEDKEGKFIFKRDPTQTPPLQYCVTIDPRNPGYTKWTYMSHSGLVEIIHDGINPSKDKPYEEEEAFSD